MTETFATLLLAHVLADFIFQSKSMADRKAIRDPMALGLHALIILGLNLLLPGNWHWGLLALTLAHIAIDVAKSVAPERLASFLADQGAHLLTILLAAIWMPELWANGYWATGGWAEGGWMGSLWPNTSPLWRSPDWLPGVMVVLAGMILATRAGGFAVGLLIAPLTSAKTESGLPGGGALIGLLERGLVFLLILVGQPAGIGFLIAAKSVLRFGASQDDRGASEYIIIGTLASFGWAMAVGWAVILLLSTLPPIGIQTISP